MLELKEFELKDEAVLRKEWEFIRDLPANENGFSNAAHGIGWDEFLGKYIPRRIQFLTGESLEEGLVRQADYLLWADDAIAGIFRIRAELNDFLRNVDGGHIGYGIKREFRGKGLATYGLRLALDVLQEKTSDKEAVGYRVKGTKHGCDGGWRRAAEEQLCRLKFLEYLGSHMLLQIKNAPGFQQLATAGKTGRTRHLIRQAGWLLFSAPRAAALCLR